MSYKRIAVNVAAVVAIALASGWLSLRLHPEQAAPIAQVSVEEDPYSRDVCVIDVPKNCGTLKIRGGYPYLSIEKDRARMMVLP
jgi:hypothetical protein